MVVKHATTQESSAPTVRPRAGIRIAMEQACAASVVETGGVIAIFASKHQEYALTATELELRLEGHVLYVVV